MEVLRAHVRFTVCHAAIPSPAPVVFEGYASVFNTPIDAHVPTIIERGAFTRTLMENRERIKILWQHNVDEPIGRPLELREDERGLFLRAQLSATERGQEAAELLRDGVMTEMSIGFDVVNFYMAPSGADVFRHITELRLWEVSLVTFGANPQARITQVHRRFATNEEELAALDEMLTAHDWRQAQRRFANSDPVARQLREIAAIERALR